MTTSTIATLEQVLQIYQDQLFKQITDTQSQMAILSEDELMGQKSKHAVDSVFHYIQLQVNQSVARIREIVTITHTYHQCLLEAKTKEQKDWLTTQYIDSMNYIIATQRSNRDMIKILKGWQNYHDAANMRTLD